LWDLDDLTPKVKGDWGLARGPRLPFEFSRVSDKRKQALVVIIDYDHGVECATSHIHSIRTRLDDAVDDLAQRERAQAHFIGHCRATTDGKQSGNDEAIAQIRAWLLESPYDAAVWTDLPRNFEDRLQVPFTIDAAISYLRTLQATSLEEARRYIENAPQNVETPLRAALREQDWWRAIAY
jgi:hypothetical protein